ncbi:MAG: hypothetical protein Q8N88_00765 [Nanoarchaeota archaeon]|nr:hypothetical protein [Nanoarchaeota archaeon]
MKKYKLVLKRHFLFLTVCFFTSLFLASCSISFKTVELKPYTLPTSKSSMYKTKIKNLIDDMIKMGIAKSVNDFEGVQFSFTVWDNLEKPVPFSYLVLDFDTLGRFKVGLTNQEGKLFLSFSKELINLNPTIFGMKGDSLYGVFFSMTGNIDIDERGKPTSLDLYSLNKKYFVNDIIYYSNSLGSDWLEFTDFIIIKQRQFIFHYLGIESIPWGMALVDEVSPIYLSPPTENIDGKTVKIFPYSTKDRDKPTIAMSNLHEWIEQTLKNYKELPRWIADGLSENAQLQFAMSLSATELKQFGVNKEWIKNYFAHSRTKILKEYNIDSDFNLLSWQYPNIDYPLSDPSQYLGYRAAASFWYTFVIKYGADKIKIILQSIKESDTTDNELILKTMNDICSQDFSKELKYYKIKSILDYYNSTEKELLEKLDKK